MEFDIDHVRSVEFGVVLDTDEGESYCLVPCVRDVQDALTEMLSDTCASIFDGRLDLQEFSPAEKYAATEPLRMDLQSEFATKYREMYLAENLPTNSHALDETDAIVAYFAIFRDQQRRKLVAIRRAAQFKGVLKKRLITFSDDSLRIIPDNVFKLDSDFDFFITRNQIYIWRPSGFIYAADMEGHLKTSAQDNLAHLARSFNAIDFEGLGAFVTTHKRAMRLIAAIKSRDDLNLISRRKLRAACRDCGIEVAQRNGRLAPAEGHEMAFLMLLDRRRYTVTLIEDRPEIYEAASRHLAKPN